MLDPSQLSPLPNYSRRSDFTTTTSSNPAVTLTSDDFEFVVQEQEQHEEKMTNNHINQDPLFSRQQQDDIFLNDNIMIQKYHQQQQPTTLKVLFMGDSLSDKHKNNVLKKFSEALAFEVQRQPHFHPSFLSPTTAFINNNTRMDKEIPMTFNERKHHVIFLDTFESEPIDTYEDNGISVIEVDFTWSTTISSLLSDENTLLFQQQQQQHFLQAYINHYWKKLDLVVYFFSSHSMTNTSINRVNQEMIYLKQLSNDYNIPIWPILVHRPYERTGTSSSASSSRPSTNNTFRTASPNTPTPYSTAATTPIKRFRSPINNNYIPMMISDEVDPISLKQSFLEQLIQHEIQCVDLPGINPERPNFMGNNKNKKDEDIDMDNRTQQQLDIMTVDQFITIDKKELAQMLKRWHKSTKRARLASATLSSSSSLKTREHIIKKLGIIGSILGILLLLVSGITYNSNSNQNEWMVNNKKEQAAVEKVQLHPMWNIVNQETLRHLFLIQLPPSLQNNQNLDFSVLLLDHHGQLQEYPMEYKQQQGSYSVDVPSPCLLNDDHDYIASVFWYHPQQQQELENMAENIKKSENDNDMILIDRVALTVEACDRMMAIQSTFGANKMCKMDDDMTLSTIITYPHNVDDALKMLMTSIKALWTFLLHGLYKNIIEE
ncbi:hypothetical protein INT45_008521 [Circinella minor]|uniref:Uncharacterized protein n=1 Tax=Circinella minor TaxID=1195481 RepID=A0A8H7SFN9_9FUNG|nr:hypothetical protein INT45_008521 [Circinella minor]